MKLVNIIKKLFKYGHKNLAKLNNKKIINDITDFNEEEILNLIYDTYVKTSDDNLVFLHQDIREHGILITYKKYQAFI